MRWSILREPWFWLVVLAVLSATAFGAFTGREGYAADEEMRRGGWVLGQTVTLVITVAALSVAVMLRRRARR